jgi:superfamily II DNA or RNA helicase
MIIPELPPLWSHQARAINLGFQAKDAGYRCIAITSPTGSGKRRVIAEMCKQAAQKGERSLILTNRRAITWQTVLEAEAHELDYGMLAAGYKPSRWQHQITVAMVQTARSRLKLAELPETDNVYIDECHNRAFEPLRQAYLDRGATVFGFTATPVGLQGYDHLIVAAKPSELVQAGVIVPCRAYSPEQPLVKGVMRWKVGEHFDERLQAIINEYRTEVFANVLDWWLELNPFGLPTMLFAPGVPESRWFAEAFTKRGIPAAHIDGETSDHERERIMNASREGSIKVVCSCGVLREGADWPWIRHGILVQVCGQVSTYLQIVGRLLRAYPGKGEAILQDHAGAYYRHGSPNEDRVWRLGDTDASIARATWERRKDGKEPEPIRCPRCGGERRYSPKCPHCGYEHSHSVRIVRFQDGKLREVRGNLVKKRKRVPPEQREWTGCLYAAANRGMTLGQAAGWYHQKTGKWPTPDLKPAPPPRDSTDWARECGNVYPWLLKRRNKGS